MIRSKSSAFCRFLVVLSLLFQFVPIARAASFGVASISTDCVDSEPFSPSYANQESRLSRDENAFSFHLIDVYDELSRVAAGLAKAGDYLVPSHDAWSVLSPAQSNQHSWGCDQPSSPTTSPDFVATKTASASGPVVDESFQFPGAGRSGAGVKNFEGPPNAVVKGASPGRVFVTDGEGRVILDITADRVKPVVPGQGFVAGDGRKLVPTIEQLDWIKKLWG